MVSRMRQHKLGYGERAAATLVEKMLSAVLYCHHHGVVHRDIKLDNFIYENEAEDVRAPHRETACWRGASGEGAGRGGGEHGYGRGGGGEMAAAQQRAPDGVRRPVASAREVGSPIAWPNRHECQPTAERAHAVCRRVAGGAKVD